MITNNFKKFIENFSSKKELADVPLDKVQLFSLNMTKEAFRDYTIKLLNTKAPDNSPEMSKPFDLFWIEISDDYIFKITLEQKLQRRHFESYKNDIDKMMRERHGVEPADITFNTIGVLCSPRGYICFSEVLVKDILTGLDADFINIEEIGMNSDDIVFLTTGVVVTFIALINDKNYLLGEEKIPKIKFKTGTGSSRTSHEINKIIHISHSNNISKGRLVGRQIDWSHRWIVRGHWRKIRGAGKDANGTMVFGKTWIRAFEKGPEDKPLVSDKIRIFDLNKST